MSTRKWQKGFDLWMRTVNKELRFYLCGMDSRDLPDRLWADAYDDGLTRDEAIECLIGDVWSEDGLEEVMWNLI